MPQFSEEECFFVSFLRSSQENLLLPSYLGFYASLTKPTDFTQPVLLPTIYRRFKGSRLENIAISMGIVETGSAEAALKGNHYKRGMRIHKLTNEALLRLIIDQLKELNPPNSSIISKLKDLEGNSSNTTSFQEKFDNIFNGNDVHQYIHSCFETIRNMNSPRTNFWLSYMEMVEILFLHYHLMRTQNWKGYK